MFFDYCCITILLQNTFEKGTHIINLKRQKRKINLTICNQISTIAIFFCPRFDPTEENFRHTTIERVNWSVQLLVHLFAIMIQSSSISLSVLLDWVRKTYRPLINIGRWNWARRVWFAGKAAFLLIEHLFDWCQSFIFFSLKWLGTFSYYPITN